MRLYIETGGYIDRGGSRKGAQVKYDRKFPS